MLLPLYLVTKQSQISYCVPFNHTANVYRVLQGVYREIRVQGFQIYGDCLVPQIPVILKSPHSHFHCGEFDFTKLNYPRTSYRYGPNVSTTPLQQWGFRQCLPLSWTTLRSKHCRHPIAVMGVVDTFGHGLDTPH